MLKPKNRPMDLLALKTMPKLSAGSALNFVEAASVCLEDRGHAQGVAFSVSGSLRGRFALNWPSVTEDVQASHNDLIRAAEDGAYGVALLVCSKCANLTMVMQSKRGTGFDYWLGDAADPLFQNKARLEVSGILSGDNASLGQRLKTKVAQVAKSKNSGLKAYVAVVEFGAPRAKTKKT